jgi:hypothetical protein
LKGIATEAKIVDLDGETFEALDISSVATYSGGARALITFAAAHKMRNGDSLTIENASESTYNATHRDVWVIDAKKVVIHKTYVAEADTSAWTGSSANSWKESVEAVKSIEIVNCAIDMLQTELYDADTLMLNSTDYRKNIFGKRCRR